ncbi:hypothetical protein CLIB1444_03S05908 [[Candida] jaroonii]|uniref:Uncharacterized protein n=1 Tax=[Candida] jaroonii TaxID=467808 RepID=A0ACA9Y5W2_9ASCO|nr:hypothetical protein CLIB1444_03S05908 [[Candida] jaroonii]
MADKDHERRPNPKGWTPPKAPYNPYDPNDARPPSGYPSEYDLPKAQSGFTSTPKDSTQYKKVNETMRRLNYTPRPISEIYPGQYKVLRRIDSNKRLHFGTKWFGTFITGSLVVYGMFFYRWNDGYENVTSDLYRFRISVKERFFKLTDEEYMDLHHPKGVDFKLQSVRDVEYIPDEMKKTKESNLALSKPAEKHVLEAQRIQQQQEEDMLRSMDKPSKKKWGIFGY